MPRPRFKRLPAEKQRRILDVARAEFAENGFEAASYNRIIEQAGLSKGAMYYYFDDKTDLYATVLDAVHKEMEARLGPFDLEEDFWGGFERLIRKSIELAQEEPDLGALVRGLTQVPRNDKDSPIAKLYERSREMTRAIIEQGQRLGAVRTDIPDSLLVSVAFSMGEAIDFWLLEHFGEFAVEGDVDETVRIVMRLWRDVVEKKEEA